MLIRKNFGSNFLDSIFDEHGDFFNMNFSRLKGDFNLNVIETKNEFQVEADLPGVKKEDIKIETEGDILTVSAKREFNKTEEKSNYLYKESFFGSFSRKIKLKNVDTNNINAEFLDGVLKIKLGKTILDNKKSIEIV
jgi:HSP20 family protein